MNLRFMRITFACFVLSACLVFAGSTASAQCATCATPTVAYSPVVAQPVYTGWYPGRFFDRMRTNRYYGRSYTAAYAPTYTAAYAPTYTAAYAPTYTAAYTPYTAAYAYTASYQPYLTSYAPLTRTSYYVPTSSSCGCQQQVVMSPVSSCCDTCGCNPCGCEPCGCGLSSCSTCSSCSSCSSCSGGVGQAVYSEPAGGCANCAGGTGTPTITQGPSIGPATPQPQLAPNESVPGGSGYGTQRPITPDPALDPKPVTEEDASTYFEAPRLFNPRDLTASRQPTVPVRQAVYKQPVASRAVSSAPQTDANGWYAVPADR